MKYLLSATILIAIVVSVSCKSARKVQSAINKKDTTLTTIINNAHNDSILYIREVLQKVEQNKITDFNTFSAKIKVDYKDKEGSQPELTVFVRIQKDSIIWVSINATILSYEALRILITPDSVKVLNKRDKVVQFRSVSYLQELTQLPFDFVTLQNFLLGNPVYFDSSVVAYKKGEESVVLMNVGQYFKHLITLSNNDYHLEQSKLDDVDPIRNRTCYISYSNYENKSGKFFSTRRRLSVSEKSKLDVDMDFKQYAFNETLSFPFAVPRKYKQN
jgi:hypothetical protein